MKSGTSKRGDRRSTPHACSPNAPRHALSFAGSNTAPSSIARRRTTFAQLRDALTPTIFEAARNGFIMMWTAKETLGDVCLWMEDHGFAYVENFQWIHVRENGERARTRSPFFNQSKSTLLLFRQASKEAHVELRHQREFNRRRRRRVVVVYVAIVVSLRQQQRSLFCFSNHLDSTCVTFMHCRHLLLHLVPCITSHTHTVHAGTPDTVLVPRDARRCARDDKPAATYDMVETMLPDDAFGVPKFLELWAPTGHQRVRFSSA